LSARQQRKEKKNAQKMVDMEWMAKRMARSFYFLTKKEKKLEEIDSSEHDVAKT